MLLVLIFLMKTFARANIFTSIIQFSSKCDIMQIYLPSCYLTLANQNIRMKNYSHVGGGLFVCDFAVFSLCCDFSCGILGLYRVIQNKGPPYLGEIRNIQWKLRIAFSNTIYLTIIWSFLGLQHLPRTRFLGKPKKVNFYPIFTQKWPLNCLKISKIKSIQWFPCRTELNKAK